ncbi:MAG TPA: signal peptidase II [Desertimonas sp.]|nr:signal peptidase II [Desertimonas sp.]
MVAASSRLRLLRWPLAIAAAVVVLDQLTKHWAVNALDDGHVIDLVGSLRLKLAFNTGMAFSRGEGIGPFVPILAITVVALLLMAVGRSSSPWFTVGVGLIVGGTLGNVIDRLFRGEGWFGGAVVDFVDVQWWPVFNLADAAIVVGAGLLLLTSLRAP